MTKIRPERWADNATKWARNCTRRVSTSISHNRAETVWPIHTLHTQITWRKGSVHYLYAHEHTYLHTTAAMSNQWHHLTKQKATVTPNKRTWSCQTKGHGHAKQRTQSRQTKDMVTPNKRATVTPNKRAWSHQTKGHGHTKQRTQSRQTKDMVTLKKGHDHAKQRATVTPNKRPWSHQIKDHSHAKQRAMVMPNKGHDHIK